MEYLYHTPSTQEEMIKSLKEPEAGDDYMGMAFPDTTGKMHIETHSVCHIIIQKTHTGSGHGDPQHKRRR